jgi:hypothetical protein
VVILGCFWFGLLSDDGGCGARRGVSFFAGFEERVRGVFWLSGLADLRIQRFERMGQCCIIGAITLGGK